MKKSQFKLFIKFAKYLLPYRKKEVAVIALSLCAVLLSLVNPYLTKLVVDRGFAKKDLRIFVILALIGVGVFILTGLINGFKNYLSKYIDTKVSFDLNKKLFRHIARLDLSYFQARFSGEHIYKLNYDIERARDFITIVLPDVITFFPRILFTLIIVFYLNWELALFSVFMAAFLYLPPLFFTKKIRPLFERLIKDSEIIFKHLAEFFSHIYLIKAFGREERESRHYIKRLVSNIRIRMENAKLETVNNFAQGAADKLVMGVIAFFGGYQVIKGKMTLGSLTAIMVYLGQLVNLQSHFALFFQKIAMGLISCQRLEDILMQTPMIIKGTEEALFKSGEIIFKDVEFGYREKSPVLKNISLNIKSGSYIALAGHSGCGKTTLLNLLVRLYEPWRGKILIDGYDIRNLKHDCLKTQIGVALQAPFLWNDTVENNIKYGNSEASPDEVLDVARISGVDDFVVNFTQKYQAVIGEEGCNISEGQKQKIAIARALIKNPKILILDEAMSSMDSESEEKILFNIKNNRKGLTLITVSHRLSAVMKAELVYFLDRRGQLTVGSGEELLRDNKEFSELFKTQAKDSVLTK